MSWRGASIVFDHVHPCGHGGRHRRQAIDSGDREKWQMASAVRMGPRRSEGVSRYEDLKVGISTFKRQPDTGHTQDESSRRSKSVRIKRKVDLRCHLGKRWSKI